MVLSDGLDTLRILSGNTPHCFVDTWDSGFNFEKVKDRKNGDSNAALTAKIALLNIAQGRQVGTWVVYGGLFPCHVWTLKSRDSVFPFGPSKALQARGAAPLLLAAALGRAPRHPRSGRRKGALRFALGAREKRRGPLCVSKSRGCLGT